MARWEKWQILPFKMKIPFLAVLFSLFSISSFSNLWNGVDKRHKKNVEQNQ
jgi:hypothetical protein